MLRVGLLATAAALVAAREVRVDENYDEWLSEMRAAGHKHTGSREAFDSNVATIRAHNADPANTWRMGVNQYTALTRRQFRAATKGFSKGARPQLKAASTASHQAVGDLPTSIDWRTKGVVTPVKNQGMCGGCWAFSATETLESHIAIETGKLFTLSQQEILDCTPNPDECGGTGGCNGATQELAFAWVETTGITTDADYPWTGTSTFPNCQTNKIQPVANITGYVTLPFNNYTALMNAVATIGPIAISADAEPWQMYESGVFSSNCGWDIDHAIVLVGYGTDSASGLDYWLVRNSWGTGWGEQGYIRVARYGETPAGEPCGIDNTPGDGDGCKGGPASIKVCGLCGILSDSSYAEGGHLV